MKSTRVFKILSIALAAAVVFYFLVPASVRKVSSSRTSQPEASTASSVVLVYTRVVA